MNDGTASQGALVGMHGPSRHSNERGSAVHWLGLLLLCIGAGGLCGYAPKSSGYGAIVPVALTILFAVVLSNSRNTALSTFLFFAAYFCNVLELFGITLAERFSFSPGSSALVLGALSAYLALPYALAVMLARHVSSPTSLAFAFRFACLVVGCEYARTYFLIEAPWGLLAYGVTDSAFLRLAPWVGVWGATFALVCLAAATARALVNWRLDPKVNAGLLVAYACIWAWCFSPEGLPSQEARRSKAEGQISYPVTAYSWSSPVAEKHDRTQLRQRLDRLFDQTARSNPGTIVFPETAVPFPWDGLPPDYMRRQLQRTPPGRHLVIGTYREDATGAYNTAAIFERSTRSGEVHFIDKAVLMPVGEYVPALLAPLARHVAVPGQALLPGQRTQPHTSQKAALLICNDLMQPGVASVRQLGADWMILISDLSWFAGRSAAIHEGHVARWRAAENRIWLLKVSAGEPSALFGPTGMVEAMGVSSGDLWVGNVPGRQGHAMFSGISAYAGAALWVLLLCLPTIMGCAYRKVRQ